MEQRVNSGGQSSTTSRAIVEAIFRYKRRFLATLVMVSTLVLLYTFFAPRQYRSEMNILVRNTRPDYQITPERTNGSSVQPDVTEERINSEIEVLRSRDVADRVVDPAWSGPTESSQPNIKVRQHEKALENFNKHLSVELLRKSNVIHVAYTTSNPRLATTTVERLLNTFLAKQHELERSNGASTFFANEQERYKHELDVAQKQLSEYQQSHQIVSLSDKEAALEQQIVELQQQMRATDIQISDLSERLASGRAELQTLTQRQTTQQRTVPNILAMEQLSTMLAGYRNQKTALLTKFLPTDRLVQEVDQQIVNTSEALRTASETQPSEKTTDVNPLWQQLNSVMSQNAIDRSAAIARRRDQKVQLDTLQSLLVTTEGSTVEFNTLQAKVTELQGNYQLYTQKRNEAQVANSMDQQQLVNVAIAERPTYSATPSSPKMALTLSLGTLSALLLAFSVVFFSEMGRDTIASPWELEAITTTPILATVPLIQADYLTHKDATPPGSSEDPKPSPSSYQVDEAAHSPSLTGIPSPGLSGVFSRLISSFPHNRGPGLRHPSSVLEPTISSP